jgi:hypothetical protein
VIIITGFIHEFDHNKQIFVVLGCPEWPGLGKTDNSIRMITLTVITISGGHCIYCFLLSDMTWPKVITLSGANSSRFVENCFWNPSLTYPYCTINFKVFIWKTFIRIELWSVFNLLLVSQTSSFKNQNFLKLVVFLWWMAVLFSRKNPLRFVVRIKDSFHHQNDRFFSDDWHMTTQ